MGKSNLLKEAIADAKAVRETALANARLRMEEAFTPRLQSMISAKLQNEIEGEDEEEIVDEPIGNEMPAEEPVEAPVEEPVEEPVGDDIPVEEPVDMNAEPEGEEDFEAPVEEPVEIETEPEVDIEVEPSDEEDLDGDELDLESIIRELENDSNIDDEMDEPTFMNEEEESEEEEEEEEYEETIDEDKVIVPMKNVKDATSNLTASAPKAGGGDQTSPDRGKPFSSEKGGEGKVSTDLKQNSKNAIYEEEEEGEDEEINLDEILRELEEADLSASTDGLKLPDESNPFESMNEQLKSKVTVLTKDLKEHRQVIKFLKSKLNEVNLLNAKLLFTSKLFKSNNMSNNEKMKVIESFDRAKTLREVKLVYSTIAESTTVKSNTDSKKVAKKITESIGGASKPVASTKPVVKKVISEGIVSVEGAERLMKLAGIKSKKK